jgi:dTDP-4-dehydrorhamnose 3,5-epimerase-like enzyme
VSKVAKHVLEKREDDRGWVVDPIARADPGAPLGHLHLASLAPGAIRGNHVHPASSEFILVWGGRAELAWEEDGRVVREEVSGDELVVFEIPAGVAHAVTNTGLGTVYLVAYYFGASDREWPDTERKAVS